MNNKHRKTLEAVFKSPIASNIVWRDVVSLLIALGAYVEEGAGSRVCVELNDRIAIFHRPHPRKEVDKGAIKSVQKFLLEAEIR